MISPSDVFKPAEDASAYRTALGRFVTGVTVVTAMGEAGRPIGMTANSFTSISLEPPLVLWSPAKVSARHGAFVAAEHYAIHVLAAEQRPVCDAFSRSQHGFDDLGLVEVNARGVPLISGCLAVFECRQYTIHDAGDHTLILGEVLRVREREGEALMFSSGVFDRTRHFETSP